MTTSLTDRIARVTANLAIKAPCKYATTGNITLRGLGTRSGAPWVASLTAGDRILVMNQTNAVENGIYNAAAGEWSRAQDFDNGSEITTGTRVPVLQDSSTSVMHEISTTGSIVIDESLLSFRNSAGDASLYEVTPEGSDNSRTIADLFSAAVVFSGNYSSLQAAVTAAAGKVLYIEGSNSVTSRVAVSSNTTIEFLPGASVTEGSGSTIASGDAIFYINNASGVTIKGHGATITGYRRGTGTDNIVHGIGIYGCTDTRISDLNIVGAAGDGWYVAPEKDSNTPIASTRTWITNVRSYNCMRNGAAVVSAVDLWANSCAFLNTNGKDPQAGIDLEPEGGSTLLQNVNLIDCRASNNAYADFLLEIGGNATPVTNAVGVRLTRCVSHDSTAYTATCGLIVSNNKDTMANDGYIIIDDFTARNVNNHGVVIRNIDVDGQPVTFNRLSIVDCATVASGSMMTTYDSPLVIYTNTAAASLADPGGVRIHGLKVVDNTRDRTPYYVGAYGNLWQDIIITQLEWENSIGTTSWPYADDGTDIRVEWLGTPYQVNRTSSMTVSSRGYGWLFTNSGASGTVTFTLPAITAVGGHFFCDFLVLANQVLRIDPNASDRIHIAGTGDGKYIEASAVGTWIRVKYLNADGWYIETNNTAGLTQEP